MCETSGDGEVYPAPDAQGIKETKAKKRSAHQIQSRLESYDLSGSDGALRVGNGLCTPDHHTSHRERVLGCNHGSGWWSFLDAGHDLVVDDVGLRGRLVGSAVAQKKSGKRKK